MKRVATFCVVVLLSAAAALPARAQSKNDLNQLLQGTQIQLRLLTRLTTSSAKSGDPFIAEVEQPVYVGSELVLPAGTRVNGIVGGVIHSRHFPIFRGQAAMNLTFRSISLDGREVPLQMSILGVRNPAIGDKSPKRRKDLKLDEGEVIAEKTDIKGDVMAGAIGTGGGTLVGAIFSHALRGFGIGMAGSAAYILARKGKDVELPAQTSILVRTESTILLPATAASAVATAGPRAQ